MPREGGATREIQFGIVGVGGAIIDAERNAIGNIGIDKGAAVDLENIPAGIGRVTHQHLVEVTVTVPLSNRNEQEEFFSANVQDFPDGRWL